MKKIKNNLFQIAHELHEDICGGTHTSWYGRNDMSFDEQNKEVINILKSIDELYRSRTLYQMASDLHEKAFGCAPVRWGFQAWNDEAAKWILAAVVEGVPYDETPEGYDPKHPDRMIG